MSTTPIKVLDKFQEVNGYWEPNVIAELNGQQVKIARISGEFVMHSHENEDELFMVMKGEFEMVYEDHSELVREGELIVVPRGIRHQPVAKEEAWIMLFEPASTLNTGDVTNEMTRKNLRRI